MDFLNQITALKKERGYWFIRTDDGEYFDTFHDNEFIGLGWNNITVSDLTQKSEVFVKNKIAQSFSPALDASILKDKVKIGGIYNKLINFKNLKKGDAVIIPNKNSSHLAFGVVDDDTIYVDNNDVNCEYRKRRRIKWVAVRKFSTLDPVFFFVKMNRHSISNVKDYSDNIDIVMNVLFTKGEYSHLALQLGLEEDINAIKLAEFISNFVELAQIINNKYGYNESIEDTALKLNLQSPGFLEIKNKGKSILLAAFIFTTIACNDDNKLHSDKKKFYDTIYKENKVLVDSLKTNSEYFDIKKEKFDELFN